MKRYEIYDCDYWSNFPIEEDFEFSEFIDNNYVVAIGELGLWNGRVKVYKRIDTIHDFCNMVYKAYTYKVYQVGKRLYVDIYHHDGVNSFELRKLNDKGLIYLYNHEDEYKFDRIYHSLLNRYSRCANFY